MNLRNLKYFFYSRRARTDAFFTDARFREEIFDKAARESTQQQVAFLKSVGKKFSK